MSELPEEPSVNVIDLLPRRESRDARGART
jgi:hypothetical protein